MNEISYLLWSNKHQAWWRPLALGYTEDMAEAGRYDELTALHYVCKSAHCGRLDQVTCMVAAPDNWRQAQILDASTVTYAEVGEPR